MKVKKYINRMRNVLVEPHAEWTRILEEETSPKQLFLQFVLPVIIVIALASFVGRVIFGEVKLSAGSGIVIRYALEIALVQGLSYFIASFIINEGLPLFQLSRNRTLVFKLVAFSMVPVYLAFFLAGLFPGLANFLSIIAFYALVTYGYASRFLFGLKFERRYMFLLFSSGVLLVVYFILKFLFGLMLVIG